MKKQESVAADEYELRLFVTGASPNSVRAIANIKRICELYLAGNYNLEIIDVYQQPLLAEEQQLIALPMLLKSSPLPQMRLIGDMSDTQKVLKGLGKNNETTDGIEENL
ncbi:circadian clock KaiB family protein [Ferruginibacter paludis]|uniref:circadian clock KaiB family protein n=1 Tax=Ferruginibacter paludis TaxID=1310417 RepID=UPI0025B3A021|nr:circadian clock KaiB family protein [Ferruginibacter paludis]MDN3657917.1 circadian clock KaiB family protein [Ferruginibacter paludis]